MFEHHGKLMYDFVVADTIAFSYPKLKFDQLDAVLFKYKSKKYLLSVANRLKMQSLIKTAQNGYEDRDKQNGYIMGSIFRMIGSVYLSRGLQETREFILEHIVSHEIDLEDVLESFHPIRDIDALFGESAVEYHLIHDSEKYFCKLMVNGEIFAESTALSASIAKKKAAQKALYSHYTSQ